MQTVLRILLLGAFFLFGSSVGFSTEPPQGPEATPDHIVCDFVIQASPNLSTAGESANSAEPATFVVEQGTLATTASVGLSNTKTILDKVVQSDGSSVSWTGGPARYFFSDMSGPLELACGVSALYCYLPHTPGVYDAMAFAKPWVSDSSCLMDLDMAIFGELQPTYSVELWDSPSLIANLELLQRVHELESLTIYTKRTDEQFHQALRGIKATEDVRIRDLADRDRKSGMLAGDVVDPQGRPVAGATVIIYSRAGEPLDGGVTNDHGRFLTGWGIRKTSYQVEAFAPQHCLSPADTKVASAEPVAAESWELNVHLVITPARQVKPPPPFVIVGDEDGQVMMWTREVEGSLEFSELEP